jgi:hypothetical protein
MMWVADEAVAWQSWRCCLRCAVDERTTSRACWCCGGPTVPGTVDRWLRHEVTA